MNVKQILSSAFSLEHDSATPEEIREAMLNGSQVRGTNMCILVLAIFIASIGLNMNSTAVIIGAMLISPLMGGIMAIGYGIAVNDLKLVRKAFTGLMFQVFLCIVTSTVYFSLTPISIAHSELLARIKPTVWDVLIAFFGGLAGIIGVTRKEKTNVLPGVAIATALMPPLCTAGYGLATRMMNFFVGAMYLFFINSFFICVSTVIISRFMHLPRKKYIDVAARRKVKATIYVIGVITVLPSIYLAWQIVNDSLLDKNIQDYLSQEFSFSDTQVVRSAVDKKTGEIKVALLGKRLDDSRIGELQNALGKYNIKDMALHVTQTEISQGVSFEEIQQLIERELDDSQKQSSLLSQAQELETIKSELINYKARLLEYQSADFDIETITKELQSLYPQVLSCSIGRHKSFNPLTQELETGVVAAIDLPQALSGEQRDQLTGWLAVKTGTPSVTLYENIPPEIIGDEGIPEPADVPLDSEAPDSEAPPDAPQDSSAP